MRALSLFANVGIGETYLEDCGIEVVVANELLPTRADLYTWLYPESKMIVGDITNSKVFDEIVAEAKKQKIDFILATPPCQGMSVAGKMDAKDPRNSLIIKAMEAFSILKPTYMLIENVPQMLKTYIQVKGKQVLIVDYIKEICESLGYQFKAQVFDCAEYGTPQHRKRTFVRIFKKGLDWADPTVMPKITVRDAIGNLPSLEAGQMSSIPNHNAKKHNANQILWMKHTPTGKTALANVVNFPNINGRKIKGFATTYKRIDWDRPAPTITMANGSISSQNNVHPGNLQSDGTYSDARVLTVLELCRLSGLPDNWAIGAGVSESELRKVIGEAVPPKMIKALVAKISKSKK